MLNVFSPKDPDIDVVFENESLCMAFAEKMRNIENPEEAVLKLYKKGLNYDNVIDFIGENNAEMARKLSNALKFLYSDMINNYKKTDPGKNVSEYDHALIRMLTDKYFTLPMLRELVRVRKQGGKVNAYEIARGMKYSNDLNCLFKNPKTGENVAKHLWDNGYNMHGDDLWFFFGILFIDPLKNVNVKNWPGIKPEDFDFSLNFMDFIFNEPCKQGQVGLATNNNTKTHASDALNMHSFPGRFSLWRKGY